MLATRLEAEKENKQHHTKEKQGAEEQFLLCAAAHNKNGQPFLPMKIKK